MGRSPVTEDALLSRGDAIAGDLLAWLEPLRFAEADGAQEREAAYRLRYQAVLEVGMEDAASFPDGIERDDFDDGAIQIIGWDDAGPIATCRLVLPEPDRPLPFEETFGRLPQATARAVEWGRVTVDSRLRGSGGRIFMGLAARGWLSMRSRGFSTAVGVTPERLVALFRALGFPVAVLGPPKVHWGVERLPILCHGLAAVQALEHLWRMRETGATAAGAD